jgi:hypothetical protein
MEVSFMPSCFTPREKAPGIHDWVGLTASLDTVVKRKNPFYTHTTNQTLVIQPVA